MVNFTRHLPAINKLFSKNSFQVILQNMNKWFYLVACILFLSACEKDISFDLQQSENVLVVDANIENGQPPTVVLTTSLNYFSSLDTGLLSNLFVHDAVVTISNGAKTHQLKEYNVRGSQGASFYFYSIDSSDLTTAFIGELNTTYTLKINTANKVYNAVTSIPALSKKADSLWWKTAPFQDDTTKVVVMVKATDPPGLGNYVRYFTRKNSEQFWPGENSVFDDQFVDGTTYELQVDPGIDRSKDIKADSNYFKRGDTVTLKLSNIDKASYKFWNTWEFAYQSIGNPFSQPNKVLGNIDNGALGAFYGYGSSTKTLIIPK
jgi:hypothetical protein